MFLIFSVKILSSAKIFVGFKNVSLGNIIAAKSKDPIEFVADYDRELYDKYETEVSWKILKK